MNRIKELIKEAGFSSTFERDRLHRLVELTVRECAKSANDWYQNHDKIHSDPMSYVLAHFGVEE